MLEPYIQICKTLQQMDILTDLRKDLKETRDKSVSKTSHFLSTVITIAVKLICFVLTFCNSLPHALFCNSRNSCVLIVLDMFVVNKT